VKDGNEIVARKMNEEKWLNINVAVTSGKYSQNEEEQKNYQ